MITPRENTVRQEQVEIGKGEDPLYLGWATIEYLYRYENGGVTLGGWFSRNVEHSSSKGVS